MAYEQKPNTGSLFANDRREKDSQPNAKGSALIDGVHYWVSAWTNETRDGQKYQSLKFERKDDRNQSASRDAAVSRERAQQPSYDDDSSVPF